MPYIKQNERKELLDEKLNALIKGFGTKDSGALHAGEVTYAIYKILASTYFGKNAKYSDMALGLGILDSVRESLEDDFKRPYEKMKKRECGWKPEDIFR